MQDRDNCPRCTTRRSFTAAVCASVLAVASGELTACSAAAPIDNKNNQIKTSAATKTEETQFGFWMNTNACVGCGLCVHACREANGTPSDCEARRKVVRYELEGGAVRFASTACMHCARPACVDRCPAGAITRRTDGIVVVDQGRCIGCKYCKQACPFGVPHYTTAGMDKCDCCLSAGVPAGQKPYCAQACPSEALRYGSLAELYKLAASMGIEAKRIEAPTEPSLLLS